MRNYLIRNRSLTCAAALLIPFCGASFAQCSLATVTGSWAWQSHGVALMTIPGSATPVPVPYASLGTMQIDAKGRATSRGILSAGGQIQEFEFPGSVQVNADCTATDTYAIGPVEGADRMVILDNGNAMQVMPTKHPLGPVAGRAYFWRLAWGAPYCTTEMVRGLYAGTAEGTLMVPVSGQPQAAPAPYSAIGTMFFERDGNGPASLTAALGDNALNMEFPKTSIEVASDCTATVQWSGVARQIPGQTLSGKTRYIVLNHGSELIGLAVTNALGLPVTIDHYKRVSMAPAGAAR